MIDYDYMLSFGTYVDSIEKQLNRQGWTLAEDADAIQQAADAANYLWINNYLTQHEYDKVTDRVMKKIEKKARRKEWNA